MKHLLICLITLLLLYGCIQVPVTDDISSAYQRLSDEVPGTHSYDEALINYKAIQDKYERNNGIVDTVGGYADGWMPGLGGILGLAYALYTGRGKKKAEAALDSTVKVISEVGKDILPKLKEQHTADNVRKEIDKSITRIL